VTPVILVNLSLYPQVRYRNENLLLSCLIPGSKKHVLLDTFLYPMVEEMKLLDAGIPGIYNHFTKSEFELHAWILFVSADGPASAEAMGMVNPGNGISPCHHCQIRATKAPNGHYYPKHSPEDWIALKPRQNLRQMIEIWDQTPAVGVRNNLSTLYGIVRKSILLELSSLHFPRSFPLDLMHCVLLNVLPKIVQYWGGHRLLLEERLLKKLKKSMNQNYSTSSGTNTYPASQSCTSPEQPSYVLSNKQTWKDIGNMQERSRASIPQMLGQGPRRIDKHIAGYKAKEWEALLLRDGPVLFADIPELEPFLENFKVLARLYSAARSWSISPKALHKIEIDCKLFVKTHERLYYGGDPSRLTTCLINNHSLLHLCKLPTAYVANIDFSS
jgi:Transposase family tnp2